MHPPIDYATKIQELNKLTSVKTEHDTLNLFEIPRVFFGPLAFFPRLPLFLSFCWVCLCSVGLRSPFPPSIRQVISSLERQRGKADVSDINDLS